MANRRVLRSVEILNAAVMVIASGCSATASSVTEMSSGSSLPISTIVSRNSGTSLTPSGCDVSDVQRVVDGKTGLSWVSPVGWTQKSSVADAFGIVTSAPGANGDDSDRGIVVSWVLPASVVPPPATSDLSSIQYGQLLARGWTQFASNGDATPQGVTVDQTTVSNHPATRVRFTITSGRSTHPSTVTGVVVQGPAGPVALVSSTTGPSFVVAAEAAMATICMSS